MKLRGILSQPVFVSSVTIKGLRMNRVPAVISFLSICLILAVLLITRSITFTISGILFAIALVLFGGFSKGFKKDKGVPKLRV